MPEFSWEPLDFLNALGVVPVEEEYGVSYTYPVDRDPLSMTLTIWPFNCDVELAIRCKGLQEPVIYLKLIDSPGARVAEVKGQKFIEFAAANLFTGRYDHTAPAPYGFRLWLEPHLQVTTFSYNL
jgi:hypothetical protein